MTGVGLDDLMELLRQQFPRMNSLELFARTDPLNDRVLMLVRYGKPRLIDVVSLDMFSIARCMESEYLGRALTPIFASVEKLRWLDAQRMAHSRYLRRRNPRVPRGRALKRAAGREG